MWTLALLLLACGPELDGYDGILPDDTGSGSGATADAWDWWGCDLSPGSGDDDAECAWVELPLDHDAPAGDRFQAMLKRRVGTGPGQLWVMHGGPGASAVDDLGFLPAGLLEARPDLTVYGVDHRGTGGTLRLGCGSLETGGVSEEEWPDCVVELAEELADEHGAMLDQVTTLQSARDVGWLIEQLAQPDDQVFIYGGSYGTYLALRYLQLFPDQPDGVVLDGISPPGDGFIGYDSGMSAVGEQLMALCGSETTCAAHFDQDPLAVAQGLSTLYDEGHCAALGTDGAFIRYFLGSMLFYDKLRDMVPAAVHRFERCSDDDVDVIVTLYYAVTGALGRMPAPPPPSSRFLDRPVDLPVNLPPAPPSGGNTGQGYSYGLFYHVALSEMWHEAGQVSAEEVDAAWQGLTMSTGLETWLAAKVDWWPTYDKDALWGQVPDYEGPLLMLQGGLDPATTPQPALALAEHFTGPAQTLAYFPQGAHGLIDGSTLPDGGNCGDDIFQAFLAEPTATLDTACIAQTQGVQWDGYDAYNQYFMGTDDIWGDG